MKDSQTLEKINLIKIKNKLPKSRKSLKPKIIKYMSKLDYVWL